MRITKKIIPVALLVIGLLFNTRVKAQTSDPGKWRLGFGLEGGLPTGAIHDASNFELGGTACLQYSLSNNLAITFTSGYYNFFSKTIPITVFNEDGSTSVQNFKAANQGVIPIKLGIKDFFAPNIYFGAEAGAGIETNGTTKLILSPAIGWANKSIDVGVRYENFSGNHVDYGMVALRVAYGFKL